MTPLAWAGFFAFVVGSLSALRDMVPIILESYDRDDGDEEED
jgi:hypothetical protein